MKNRKISVGLSEKISLEAHLGPKYKFCTVEPWFRYEAELDENEESSEMVSSLRGFLNAELREWKRQIIASRKGELE